MSNFVCLAFSIMLTVCLASDLWKRLGDMLLISWVVYRRIHRGETACLLRKQFIVHVLKCATN